jgi:hypothetical protein
MRHWSWILAASVLLTALPSRADTARPLSYTTELSPSFWRRDWLTVPAVPLSVDPDLSAWLGRRSSPGSSDRKPSVISAPLVIATSADGTVWLSLSPGAPCTGACLKLQGSF